MFLSIFSLLYFGMIGLGIYWANHTSSINSYDQLIKAYPDLEDQEWTNDFDNDELPTTYSFSNGVLTYEESEYEVEGEFVETNYKVDNGQLILDGNPFSENGGSIEIAYTVCEILKYKDGLMTVRWSAYDKEDDELFSYREELQTFEHRSQSQEE